MTPELLRRANELQKAIDRCDIEMRQISECILSLPDQGEVTLTIYSKDMEDNHTPCKSYNVKVSSFQAKQILTDCHKEWEAKKKHNQKVLAEL
jgi:hypothetical protein